MVFVFLLRIALSLNLPLPDFLKRVARQWLMKKVSSSSLAADSAYQLQLGPDRCAGCSSESPDCDIEPCFEDITKNEDFFG